MGPPCISFRRTLTPVPFQSTPHAPATTVWDETELRNLPGLAEGRHHCHWRRTRGQPASATLKSPHAGGPKAAPVWAPLCRPRDHRAKRALVGSRPVRRQRHYRAGAARARSRPRGHPKSTTRELPFFPRWSDSDRSRHRRDACRSPHHSQAQAIAAVSTGKV
jgi:hypothetical protein